MTRLLCLLALLVPAAAGAQPRLIPATDVDVVYRVEGAAAERIPGGAPQGVRLQWDAAGRRLRAEAEGMPVYAITDLPNREEEIVFAQQSSVLVLPLRGGDPRSLLAGADVRFTRRGAGRVLGIDCTEWQIEGRKVSGAGCVTADGIVLRASGTFDGQPGQFTALSVARGPIPPERFVAPAGFFRLPLGHR